ncbi:MAG TPA: hypothetical protein VKH20_00970 [Solirubrobacterales bacterium]|nr:hypothetical protein [Solirubrobacterales bacterium]
MPRIRLFVPLLFLAILVTSQITQALADTEEPSLPLGVAFQVSEEEDEGETEGECVASDAEEVDGSDEAEEECEAEAEDAGFSPAEDCYLRTATARVVAYPDREMMRLTLGYTTYTPAPATVEYGAKKDPHLGSVRRQLGRSGVLRLSKHLASGQMTKVETSGHFTVTVRVPEAPRACQRFEVQQLQVAQSSKARVTWAEAR